MEGEDYDDIGFEFAGLDERLLEGFVQREVLDKAAQALDKATLARARVGAQLKAPPFVRAVDKLSFCVGVLYLLATEGLLLAAPRLLHRWYVWSIVPLLLLRFRSYHAAKFHYFMLDFCYFAQAMLLFYVALYPRSRILFQLVFCFANGPLAWGIVAWNNSLVFHDLDKMTSVAIHIMPAIGPPALHLPAPSLSCSLALALSLSSLLFHAPSSFSMLALPLLSLSRFLSILPLPLRHAPPSLASC